MSMKSVCCFEHQNMCQSVVLTTDESVTQNIWLSSSAFWRFLTPVIDTSDTRYGGYHVEHDGHIVRGTTEFLNSEQF